MHHAWNCLWSTCPQIGSWWQHIWFGFWSPHWSCQTTNLTRLCCFFGHVSHCRTSAFDAHFDHRFNVLKNILLSFVFWRICVRDTEIYTWQLLNLSFPVSFELGVEISQVISRCMLVGNSVLFEECNTASHDIHRSRAKSPSIRKPTSKEITSESEEHVRHWRLRLAYPTYRNKCSTSEDTSDSPEVDSESSSSPAMSEINPIDNAEPCFPHGNIVCHHSYDACKRSNEPSGCLKLESILWQLVRFFFVGPRDSFCARFLPPWQFFSCRFSMYCWCIPRWPDAGKCRSSVCFMLSSSASHKSSCSSFGHALLILFHHFSSAHSDSVLWVSSPSSSSFFDFVLRSAIWRSSSGHHWRCWSWFFLFPVWTHSLLVVIWAICALHVASCERRVPPASLCGRLRLRGSILASSNTTTQHYATSWLLVRGRCPRSTGR